MNLGLKLIVLGFLLWDQNNFTQGQNATSPAPGTLSPALHATSSFQNLSTLSARIATNLPNQNESLGVPSNPQAPTTTTTVAMSVSLLANNSIAVPTALTSPTISTTMLSLTGGSNSSGTQAPTHTSATPLSPALNNGTDNEINTTAIQPTSTTEVSPTQGGDTKIYCSDIRDLMIKYDQQSETYVLFVPEKHRNKSVKCQPSELKPVKNPLTPGNDTFNVAMCTPTNVTCWFQGCSPAENITEPLNAPPKSGTYQLADPIIKEKSIEFNWKSQNEEQCDVVVNSTCCPPEGAECFVNGSIVSGLEPYTNYTCTSRLFYNGEEINKASRNLTTQVDRPGIIQHFTCTRDNTTINVTWEKPEKLNGPLNGYIVEITSKEQKHVRSLERTQERMVNFMGLNPYTKYTVNVTAYNNRGREILWTNYTENCMTTEGVPSDVTGVHAKVGGQYNSIIIECKEPANINGPSGHFVLVVNGQPKNYSRCPIKLENLDYLTKYVYKIYYVNNRFAGPAYSSSITTKYNDKALIGFLAFFITITCLALMFVLFKIYKLQKKSSCNMEDGIPLAPDDDRQLLNIDPIPVDHLLEAYKRKNADEGRLFLDEFQSIPRVFSKFPIKEARKSYNQAKNRYIDILPYDENRVVLSEIHGEPGSDYINASYINGFKEPRKYIAAQGPKEETMNDFWRMIWEQKSTIIVMVTRCEEGNRNKCAQYWPSTEDETEQYGDVGVKIMDEKFFPDYITRKLHITHRREKSERDITHIQFTVWPDHGVPDDPNLLLKLRRRINALSNFFSGPIIVHCSAGVGRTGTYITIDAMLEGLEAENRVDVYGYVVQLRRQRCLMVQVESQYIFIHKSLVEYNQFGETEINITELPHLLNNMKKKDLPSELSQLSYEFQRLPSYKNWRPQTTGNHPDNKDKNRIASFVPYEFNRVHVKVDDEPERERAEDSEMSSDEDSDSEEALYINASYIVGYWGARSIVAAQAPLKNTMSEFWRMIYQRKMKAIVMISGPSQENVNEEECAPYWKEKSKTYDDLEVELIDENPCGSYTERSFEIRHTKRKDLRKISLFHYNQWEDVLPQETKELLEMIDKVRKNIPCKRLEEQSRHDKSVSLLVHCSDGSQRTGTFCALWNLLESAQVEEVIDVFQTVKHLRRQRSGMVSSFEQYEFLYDTLASSIPAQNGQVKITIHQEDKLDEMKNKTPEETQAVTASLTEDIPPKAKDDETVANGPNASVFSDVSLRIDE